MFRTWCSQKLLKPHHKWVQRKADGRMTRPVLLLLHRQPTCTLEVTNMELLVRRALYSTLPDTAAALPAPILDA